MGKYDRSEPEKIKKTARKMMFGHLDIVDADRKVYRSMIWNLKILFLIAAIAALAALVSAHGLLFCVLFLVSLVAGCVMYGSLSQLRNEIDIHLWFAERWRVLRCRCLMLEGPCYGAFADLPETASPLDCLAEMNQLISDINTYQQRKSNPALDAYVEKRKARRLAKQLTRY